MFMTEDEGLGSPASPDDPKFHQSQIFASRIETNKHVFGPVLINEKQAMKQYHLWIECRIFGPIGTDVGRFQQLQLSILFLVAGALGERLRLLAIVE